MRTSVGLVVETGAALEVHHFAVLAGYGAEAINPYLAFDTIQSICRQPAGPADLRGRAEALYQGGRQGAVEGHVQDGHLHLPVLLRRADLRRDRPNTAFVDRYFTGTQTTVEGIGLEQVAEEAVRWHAQGYGNEQIYRKHLDVGGDYAFRLRGEDHVWTPDSIAKLQHAARANSWETYEEFARLINEQNEHLLTFRGLMDFQWAEQPIPLDEVEPAKEIVKRFATGAMSFGSISYEAHSTLAKAMNAIGGKSNTGEGGEEPERFNPLPDGSMNPERSAIKQVASGRFGVTTEYLVNADDIQIKIAQGAKPGEGGQLPGHKVSPWIARVRHSHRRGRPDLTAAAP